MGFFDFIEDVGKKLTGRDEPEPKAEPAAPSAISPDEIARRRDRSRSIALAQEVSRLGLEVEGLSIAVKGSAATVSGTAPDQATREKVVLAIGNTAGVARVDDQLTVEANEPEARFHTVERGDTLSGIAKRYYGNAMKYPVIFEANKPMLTDPDKIYPGQVLRIPAVD